MRYYLANPISPADFNPATYVSPYGAAGASTSPNNNNPNDSDSSRSNDAPSCSNDAPPKLLFPT